MTKTLTTSLLENEWKTNPKCTIWASFLGIPWCGKHVLWCKEGREQALPSEGDFDGSGEAGREEVGGQVGVHGEQLAGLAGCQLDAVLHGGRKGHLGERVAGIDGCHLNRDKMALCLHSHILITTMLIKGPECFSEKVLRRSNTRPPTSPACCFKC